MFKTIFGGTGGVFCCFQGYQSFYLRGGKCINKYHRGGICITKKKITTDFSYINQNINKIDIFGGGGGASWYPLTHINLLFELLREQ